MTARAVACIIERRLLVTYRIEPEFAARLLPWPFRPQLVSGQAVGGVCFIRLSGLRAGHLPRVPRLVSENAAHRFAVEWDDANGTHAGVFVPRRDTNSRISAAAGGKVFPAPTSSPASRSTNPPGRYASTSPPVTARSSSRSPLSRRIRSSARCSKPSMTPSASSAAARWDSHHRHAPAAWTACACTAPGGPRSP